MLPTMQRLADNGWVKAINLARVAEQAGCSQATVSRVLNDRPNVAPARRAAVLAAVRALGYEPPPRLQPVSHGVVGVLVPELTNPVFARVAASSEQALARHGWMQMVCSPHGVGLHEDETVDRLLRRGVTGLIIVAGMNSLAEVDLDRYARLVNDHVPLVLMLGSHPEIRVPTISNDDDVTVDLAVRHLARLGHTRIGFTTGPVRYQVVRRRLAAFETAIARHLPGTTATSAPAATTTYSIEGGAQVAEALLDEGVTGIVCGSDMMALGAIRAVRRRGLRVPEDVSVVGADDSDLVAFTDPPLTTVRQPIEAMTDAAVDALATAVSDPPAPSGDLVFTSELVVRASSGPAPGRAPAQRSR